MKHEVRIMKVSDGWYFQILSTQGEKVINNLLIHRKTFIEAMDVAHALRVHVESAEILPFSQYKKAA